MTMMRNQKNENGAAERTRREEELSARRKRQSWMRKI
jgi:hypothetical protein